MSTSTHHSLGRPLLFWGLIVALLCALGMTISAVNAGKTKLVSYSQRIRELNEEKHAFFDDAQQLRQQRNELKEQRVSLTVKLEETEGELRMKSEEASLLASRLQKVDADLAEARRSNEALTGQVVVLERERESLKRDIAGLYTVATNTKSQVALLERERNSLKGDIASLHAAANAQKTKIGDLETARAALQSQTDGSSGKVAEQTAHIAMLQTGIESMNKTLALMREETVSLNKAREQLSAESVALKTQVGTLTAQAQSMQATIAQKDKTIATLDGEKKELAGLRDKLSAEVAELNKKVAALMQTSQMQDTSLRIANEDKLAFKQANSDLVNELGVMTTRLTELTLENESQSKRISQLTDERDALAVERSSLSESNTEMSKKLDALSFQLSSLEGRFGAMADALAQPGLTPPPVAQPGLAQPGVVNTPEAATVLP
jgi:chromosome segregation ATPase